MTVGVCRQAWMPVSSTGMTSGVYPLTQLRLRLASSPSLRIPLPLKKGARELLRCRIVFPLPLEGGEG